MHVRGGYRILAINIKAKHNTLNKAINHKIEKIFIDDKYLAVRVGYELIAQSRPLDIYDDSEWNNCFIICTQALDINNSIIIS